MSCAGLSCSRISPACSSPPTSARHQAWRRSSRLPPGLPSAGATPGTTSSTGTPPPAQPDASPTQFSASFGELQRSATSVLLSAALAAQVLLGPADLPLAPPRASALTRLTPDETLTVDIFKRSRSSVVSVTNLATRRDEFTTNMMEIPQGTGSGFIWDSDGHVVTNFHVVTDSKGIKVALKPGDTEYSAKLVGVDEEKDIAVLQIILDDKDKGDVTPLRTCSSSADLVVGQKVYAIGNPFGLDHTLTTGIVSGTGREIQSISGRPIQDAVQTDAAINPGNSGGPLLDSAGCVIGINTAIFSPSGANAGVGFAIPIDIVKSSVQQILQYGRVVRPVIGISFAPDQSSEQLGVKGILVLSAREGGPAWKAGVRGTSRAANGRLIIGDVITAINGQSIKNASDLYRILDKRKVGDVLDVELLRDDVTIHVSITLEANDQVPPGVIIIKKAIPPKQMPMPKPPPEPLPLPSPPQQGGGGGPVPLDQLVPPAP